MISTSMAGRQVPESANLWLEPDFREAAFGLEESRELRITSWPLAQARKFLVHAIARNPRNLLQHTQRIELSIAASDASDVFSALLDLNIALGAHGKALRNRMRCAARALLTSDQSDFLMRAQDTGCSATDGHPAAPYSIFSHGLTGKLDLVVSTEIEQLQTSDPLHEAETQLRDGNLAAARTTLECALADAPERDDLASALLELYVRSQDLASLRSMRTRMGHALSNRRDWSVAEERLSQARSS